MILLPLLLQVGAVPATSSASPLDERYRSCLSLAASNPKAAESEAGRFRAAGGGARARQCLGLAYAQEGRWRDAAGAFEAAAHDGEAAKDLMAARYWAQAGNAWLAAGDAERARAALATAIAAGTLVGSDRGEALLDRARAFVIAGQMPAARADLDAALGDVPSDPLAWLLSATLARRMNDRVRAGTDIAEALRLAPDDASVQLEAGNMAALAGDEAGARAAWLAAVRIAPGTPVADNARVALAQFDAPPAPAPAPSPTPPVK